MKVCVTSQGNDLNAAVDPRFGRCQYFMIVDTETLDFKAIENPNLDSRGGAGIQSGQFVAGNQAKAVLTGNVGPKAFATLNAAGISVYTGAAGTVQEALDNFKAGSLDSAQGANVEPHWM